MPSPGAWRCNRQSSRCYDGIALWPARAVLPHRFTCRAKFTNLRRDAGILPHRRKRAIAFGWYGGKFSHLNWLLPLLPECHHYCEPFGGSAAVLINRAPSPVETYNDMDGEVVNFFRVLREKQDELVQKIALTPFSREEFFLAVERNGAPPVSDLERARLFYVRARQARTGLAQTASLGRWANCKNTSRAGMSGVVSRWLGGVEHLPGDCHEAPSGSDRESPRRST